MLFSKLFSKVVSKRLPVVCNLVRMEADVAASTLENAAEDGQSLSKKQRLEEEAVPSKEETNNNNNNKKRKYALCIGYQGSGYFGLQRNPTNGDTFRTIEDEIVEALIKIDAIPKEHASEMFKMSFQRAARTDKGVSAASNLLSLKMILDETTIPRVNQVLPKQIRVFDYRKVTQTFDAKTNCDARTYMYVLPTYAFCPIEEITTESYRASEEVIQLVNDTLKLYHGTHNFHNFTSGKKYIDPSAKRYIMSMECGKPFVRDDIEFAVITVKGQSFMLHQIRKMIGLAIAIVRGIASKDSLELCYTPDKVDMPMAPALGLMLDKLHYDKYNRKFGNDGIHKPLIWTECEQEFENFKNDFIYPAVVEKEKNSKSMLSWLLLLNIHSFAPMKGNLPPGTYCGVGRALHLLRQLNGTDGNSKVDEEQGDE